jgi:hypothetical protein
MDADRAVRACATSAINASRADDGIGFTGRAVIKPSASIAYVIIFIFIVPSSPFATVASLRRCARCRRSFWRSSSIGSMSSGFQV